MKDFIQYGGTRIEFTLKHAARATLGIAVLPSGEVEVTAPDGAELGRVKLLLEKRASWILERLGEASKNPPEPGERGVVSGAAMRFLGKMYRLKVETGDVSAVKIDGGRIIITAKDESSARRVIFSWLKKMAEEVYQDRLVACLQRLDLPPGTPTPVIKIQKMKKRWGSCSPTGTVLLNLELVTAPTDCIDYVITHEVMHLCEPSHNARFFGLMDKAMPGWKELKSKLEANSEGLRGL